MKKALIVDDNEQNLYLMQTMLKRQGYDVMMAGNGVEALGQARRDAPDIIISDILMPVMDGFTLCREWRKDERLQRIPFVFYTATYTDPRDEELALSLGAARFVVKPADMKAFAALLQQVIEERETGGPRAPARPAPVETDYYKLYSETLVRKLEDKMLELEQLNRMLEQDITERKKSEEALQEALEQYRLLADSVDSMYLVDRDCTYLFMNEGHRRRFGILLEEIIGKRHGKFHSEETDREFAEAVKEVCDTGKPSIKEYRSERDGRYFLRTFTPITERSPDRAISKVVVVSKEITARKRAEEQLQQTLQSLRNAVSATIQIMTATVEARDPYTAGHQVRSADLARAIATGMELPQEKIDAIRMAGSIHDIGKISIPAEILSKPTKLTEIEFSLIKEHARRGYEILKDVESPWNLAEIAYEHHERLDGSGYPRQLKGEEILIEARILAVADTVEAMASHRPYRPASGIDAALTEIEKNKGILYDAEAVDVCLRLFREEGFQLDGDAAPYR